MNLQSDQLAIGLTGRQIQRSGFKSRSGLNGVLNPGHFDIISQLLIRTFLTPETTNTIIHAFVTSNIDSCKCLLFVLPNFLLQRLQRVLYCAARVVYQSNKYHITPLLIEPHCLPVERRINLVKILLITYKALNAQAPTYICDLLS